MKVTLLFPKNIITNTYTWYISPAFLKRRNNLHAPKVKSKKALMGVCVCGLSWSQVTPVYSLYWQCLLIWTHPKWHPKMFSNILDPPTIYSLDKYLHIISKCFDKQMATTLLVNLKPGDGDTAIKLKVIRKWEIYGKKTECYVF